MEGEMLKRLDRQSIANFIMDGSTTLEFAEGNFDERLRRGEERIVKYLDTLKLTERERDELTYRESDLLDLYFQEGLKIGALLIKNLVE